MPFTAFDGFDLFDKRGIIWKCNNYPAFTIFADGYPMVSKILSIAKIYVNRVGLLMSFWLLSRILLFGKIPDKPV